MRAILIAIFAFFSVHLQAQRACFTIESLHELSKVKPLRNQLKITGNFKLQDGAASNGGTATPIIRIPVVVHILYNSAAQNVSDEQVKSQIEAMNRDFRKRNADTVNIPERFKSFAADVQIEFQLAVVSPGGHATNGIVRKQTHVKEWGMDDKIKFSAQGGDDAWDSRSYLNVWVGNIKKTLGYSSAINGPAEKDGIVISNAVFGTIGIGGAFNMGRTLVHETGHWLGLKHIWGDAPCGDDEVGDTPKQAGFTSGCPSEFRATCGTSALGDMYMNYMDFTNDACMYMFTQGQKERMRAHFPGDGFRNSILHSKGLDSSKIIQSPIVSAPEPKSGTVNDESKGMIPDEVLLYPNPADRAFTLKFNDVTWLGKEVKIINLNGVILHQARITSQAQILTIASLPQGVYFVLVEKSDKRIFLKFMKTSSVH